MIPNFFIKAKVPEKLPKEIEEFIHKLKKSKNKKQCIKKAYLFLSKRYRGYKLETYTKWYMIFDSNINKIWSNPGFLHCTTLNYLIRILLIKSNFFKEEDIKLKWTMIKYISPHQYLEIRISKNEVINVDLWGKSYRIPFGDYAHGFW